MKNLIMLLLALITGGFGCMSKNLVTFGNKNLVALGSVKGKSQIRIFDIKIGSLKSPFDRKFKFCIRLDSGRTINSDSFSVDAVRPFATRTNILNSGQWAGCIAYQIEGYGFTFKDEQLVGFSAADYLLPGGEKMSATLGDAKCEKFYPLPLSKEQFQNLFGEPESEERQKVL